MKNVLIFNDEIFRDENGAIMMFDSEDDAEAFAQSLPDDVLSADTDYVIETLEPVEVTEDSDSAEEPKHE